MQCVAVFRKATKGERGIRKGRREKRVEKEQIKYNKTEDSGLRKREVEKEKKENR